AYARYAGQFGVSGSSTLKRGDRGEAVRNLQSALVRRGHAIVVDGVFGRATEQAVQRFQSEHGLDADGIAGPQTLASLHAAKSAPPILSRILRLLRRFHPRPA